MKAVIYIPLLEEGTDCWRPVNAVFVSNDVYEIAANDQPVDERWSFLPNARVRCRKHVFSDGTVGLAAFQLVE